MFIVLYQNLLIKSVGSGYTLKFIGRLASHADFAQTYSSAFDVSLGDPYKLSFIRPIGTAFGGQMFSASPIVGIVDRGGNVVTDWSRGGRVTAALTTRPIGTERLLPVSGLVSDIVNGLATFDALHINEAGYPYQITFNCSEVRGEAV